MFLFQKGRRTVFLKAILYTKKNTKPNQTLKINSLAKVNNKLEVKGFLASKLRETFPHGCAKSSLKKYTVLFLTENLGDSNRKKRWQWLHCTRSWEQHTDYNEFFWDIFLHISLQIVLQKFSGAASLSQYWEKSKIFRKTLWDLKLESPYFSVSWDSFRIMLFHVNS